MLLKVRRATFQLNAAPTMHHTCQPFCGVSAAIGETWRQLMTENSEPVVEAARPSDRDVVTSLWAACGLVKSYNPPDADFDMALGKPGSDILVLRAEGEIVGSAMVGHDGHRGWMYYLAVHPDHQHHGHGERLVRACEEWVRERGMRKLQLMVRETNAGVIGFYDRIGYERSPVTVMQRRLDGDSKT
jgi:ribosomal protein S18 acetylase RimI-like enzyme